MSQQLKNFLFLAMQRGGTISPQMTQQAKAMGQLPMMQMGNDIQKMNQRQAAHYGYFQAGGEQEQIDQEYLSPTAKYSQRVSDFLKNIKEKAIDAVQDEMVQTNDAYAEEADSITGMPMAQYGAQYNQPGLDAAKAWEQMAKKTTNVVEPIIGAGSLATGLKGYWGNETAFNANPYNEQYIKKVKYKDVKGTEPVIPIDTPINSNLSQTKTLQPGGQYNIWRNSLTFGDNSSAGAVGGRYGEIYNGTANNQYDAQTIANAQAMGWGNDVEGYANSGWVAKPSANTNSTTSSNRTSGTSAVPNQTTPSASSTPPAGTVVVKNEDGTESSISPEEAKRREEAKNTGETTTTTEGSNTKTNTETKKVGDGYDYLRGLADPNSTQAGAIYTTDKKGNQVPLAFYDPNLRVISTTSDYRNPIGNIFRGEDKKKRGSLKSLTVRYGTLADGTPVALDQNNKPIMEDPNVNVATGAKEFKPQQPGFDMGWETGKQMPTYPGKPSVTKPGAVPSVVPQSPGAPQVTGPMQVAQQAPLTPRQQEKIDRINARTKRKVGSIKGDIPQGSVVPNPSVVPNQTGIDLGTFFNAGTNTPVHGPDGNWYTIGEDGKIHRSMDKETSRKMAGYAKGGALSQFIKQDGGANQAPVDPDSGLPIESNLDKLPNNKMYTNIKEAKYKFGNDNPFLAPAMMAGLDALAGSAQNKDAAQKERELRGRLAFDQIGYKVPQTSGSQGDWTFNEGYIRPNNIVPTQFTGAGPLAQMGGALNEGDELYLDDETINAILAAGGQIEYLD